MGAAYAFFQRVNLKPAWHLKPISGPQMALASNCGALGLFALMIGLGWVKLVSLS